jgi:hypothetical protein
VDVLQINILKGTEQTPLNSFRLHDVHDGPIKLQKRMVQWSSAEELAMKKMHKGESDKEASTSKGKQKQVGI